jgi:hypothetical protein
MSKAVESSVSVIASLATMYNIDKAQDVDKDTEVKYPSATYVDFKSYLDNNCEAPKEGGVAKAKVFTLEPGAFDLLNKLFKDSLIGSIREFWNQSESSFKNIDTLHKEISGLPKLILDIGEKLPSPEEFNEAISEKTGRLLADFNAGLKPTKSRKEQESSKSKKEKEIDSEIREAIVNAVVSTIFAISRSLACNLIFNASTPTSKVSAKEINAALGTLALEHSEMLELYDGLCYAGLRIETKIVKTKAASTGTKKKTTSASGKTAKNKKTNISDDEAEEEEKPKKTSRRKPVQKEDDDSGSDSSASDKE